MERVRFITYRGRQILFMDYSELQDPEEIARLIEQAKETVAEQPENSVLGLIYVRDANTTNAVKETMKHAAVHNKPYIRATAVVGMSPVQRLIYEAVNLFSKRENSCAFDDIGPAKQWLVEQDAAVAV
jgi:subtilase family serine protease